MHSARLLSAILVLIALFTLTACNVLGGPEATVHKFNRHVADGNIDKAIELLGSDCRQMGDDKWRLVLKERSEDIKEKGGIKNLQMERLEEESNSEGRQIVRLATTVTFGNGETDEDKVTLKKVEGEDWKISCTGK